MTTELDYIFESGAFVDQVNGASRREKTIRELEALKPFLRKLGYFEIANRVDFWLETIEDFSGDDYS